MILLIHPAEYIGLDATVQRLFIQIVSPGRLNDCCSACIGAAHAPRHPIWLSISSQPPQVHRAYYIATAAHTYTAVTPESRDLAPIGL